MEYPLYLKIPFSPSKNVIALSQLPVFLYPGSMVIIPPVELRKVLISMATSFSVPLTIYVCCYSIYSFISALAITNYIIGCVQLKKFFTCIGISIIHMDIRIYDIKLNSNWIKSTRQSALRA